METFYQILGLIGGGLITWIIYRQIKGKPEQFSRVNLSKSFSTMGLLAIALIGFVCVLILLLRTT